MGAVCRNSELLKGKLTRPEAAQYLGIAIKTLDTWLWKGTPSGVRIKRYRYLGRVYFNQKDLDSVQRTLIQEIER